MTRLTIVLLSILIAASMAVPGFAGEKGHEHDENHVCFVRIDADNNDKVTKQELAKFYPDKADLFEKIDQDKDGSVSHDEYEEYWYAQE